MSVHTSLLGLYRPQDGWLFHLGTGWKYLLLLLITLPPLFLTRWWVTLVFLVLVLLLLRTSGISFRRALDFGWMLWVLLGILAAYQLVTWRLDMLIISPGNLIVAVLASRMLTLTTSTPALLDAITRGLGPLRHVGIDPNKIALAVSIMMRSIPYLMGSLSDARDAARARGRDGSIFAALVPAMVGAVAYAQATGEAIHARGLVDHEPTTVAPIRGRQTATSG